MSANTLKEILRDSLSTFKPVYVKEGEYLIRQGDIADSMFWVVSGRLHVVLETEGAPDLVVAEISKGETVGEMSLVTGRVRSTSVVAARDCEVVCIPKAAFDEILLKQPQVLLELTRSIALRLASTTRLRTIEFKPKTVLFMPAGNDLLSFKDYARRFAKALTNRGSVAFVDYDTLLRLFPRLSNTTASDEQLDNDPEIIDWFDNLEGDNDFVVLACGTQPDWWSKRCMRTADRVYLVADAHSSHEPNQIEQLLFRKPSAKRSRAELVLITTPHGKSATARDWLLTRPIKSVQHASLDTEADYNKLIRLLLGEAIGLVLGGGGARGLAHIGVIKAMQEVGIPIDLVGCTSVGSIVGGLHSLGQSPNEMIENITTYSKRYRPYNKYTIPLVSLLQIAPIESFYRSLFGDSYIEDSKAAFFCVSCNLNSAQKVVHERGKFWEAVRASTAIPGAFAPLLLDNSLLVDGGVMDNLPIKEMKARGAKYVIAVDVAARDDLQIAATLDAIPSTWTLLKNRIFRRKTESHFPSITEILMRTLMVNSVAHRLAGGGAADLIVRPPVEGTGILDFSQMAQTADIGYHHSKPLLAQFKLSQLS